MKKYDSYKDSGIEWIGEIPEHWNFYNLKFILREGVKDGPHETPIWFEDGIPFLSIDGIVDGEISFNNCRYIDEEQFQKFSKKLVIEKDDIFIGKAASIGKIARVKTDRKFTVWSPIAVIKVKKEFDPIFVEYYFRSDIIQHQIELFSTSNTQKNIAMGDIPKMKFISPTKTEQTSISKFLDNKTNQIDILISKKQQFIALLQEERIAVINQVVTKGLDPKVKMKDSGSELLGEIPEHWDNPKMKYICEFILDGTHGSFNRVDDGYRLLSVRNIINNKFVFRDDDSKVSKEDFELISKRFLIKLNDIQLAIVGATLGKVAIVEDLPEKIVTQRSVATIRVNLESCNPYFLYYFILSEKFQSYLWLNAGFSAQPGVYLGTLQNSTIPLPDLLTQNIIIQYIKEKVSDIEKIIEKSQQEIELLKEYKTALISEVVTGKIDVREEVLS